MEGPPPSPDQSLVASSSAARSSLPAFGALHEYNEPPSVCWYCSQTFGNRYAFAGHHNAAHSTVSKRSADTAADQGSANAQLQPDMAVLDPPTVGLPPFTTSTCIYKPPQGYHLGVARGLLQQIRSAPRYSYRPSIYSIIRSAIPRPAQAPVVNNIPAPPNPNPSNFSESALFPSPRLVPAIHNSVECTPYEPKVIITQNAPLFSDSDLRTGNYITIPDVHDRKGKRATEDILYEHMGITRNAPVAISSGSTTGNFKAADKSDKSCVIVKDFAPLMKSYPDRESMRHLLVTERTGGYKEANLLLPNVIGGLTMAETYTGVGEEEEAKAKGLDLSLRL